MSVNEDKCIGCLECVVYCPVGAIKGVAGEAGFQFRPNGKSNWDWENRDTKIPQEEHSDTHQPSSGNRRKPVSR